MNREILFRGKRKDNNEWIYGQLFRLKYHTKKLFIRTFPDEDDNYEDYVVIPETIGQYTNLKDKNKDMIFEGDLVKSAGMKEPYTVKFDEDRGGWFPFACGDGCGCCESETEPTWCMTVVGNETDGVTNDIKEEPKKYKPGSVLEWWATKAEVDRVEGIPLEDE